MNGPRTIVIVLSYCGERVVGECLASVLDQRTPEGGSVCWLVDNGSTDGTVAMVRDRFPAVQILENGKNLGFAAGNNRAIERAIGEGAEYVALLNMDAIAEPEWLAGLVRVADSHPTAAILGSLILGSDGRSVEFDGRQFDRVLTAGGYADRPLALDEPEVSAAAYACGAAMLLRSSALEEMGLLNESFFLYHEDVELSLRAWRAGFEVLNVGGSRVRHGRSECNAASREFLGLRNLTATLFGHYCEASWRQNRETLLEFFLSGLSPARLQAAAGAVPLIPAILRQRRVLKKSATRTYMDLIGELERRGVFEASDQKDSASPVASPGSRGQE